MRHRRFLAVLAAAVFALLLGAAAAEALEPPRPGELERLRAQGKLAARQARAYALGNNKPAAGLIDAATERLRRSALGTDLPLYTPPVAWRGMPTTGTVHVLALLIDFSDMRHSTKVETIKESLFGDGSADHEPYESLHDYYDRSSYGQLDIQGDVLGWYNTGGKRSSVPQNTEGREELIQRALSSYEADFDFGPYDNDNDGVIDYLIVIWAGNNNGWSNFWWGYQTEFSDDSYLPDEDRYRLDGKSLGTYSWQWEANPWPGTFDPLVVIHETGHALGLPDYYDYQPGIPAGLKDAEGGLGQLDMMDSNWGDHNAFSKFLLGWITPRTLSAGSLTTTLAPSSEAADALVVMPGVTASDPFQQYYVVQSRYRSGNDVALPADGLLIWHVDARLDSRLNNEDYRFDNSRTNHKLLRLMEADGLEEISAFGAADAGDFYRDGDLFGAGSTPNSNAYGGSATHVGVSEITVGGMAVSFSASTVNGTGADQTPPVTVSAGAVNWSRKPVTLTFTASDESIDGVLATQYRVDGDSEDGRWQTGVSPVSTTIAADATTHDNDGMYVVAYRSVDVAGNIEATKSATVRVDTLGPWCTAPSSRTVRRGRRVSLVYTVGDYYSPRFEVTIKVRRNGRTVKTLRASSVTSGRHTRSFTCTLKRGLYTYTVTAKDRAGNAQTHSGKNTLRVK